MSVTIEQVENLLGQGVGPREIAKCLGVSPRTVYHLRFPEKEAARIAVRKAVESGLIQKPNKCSECNKKRAVEGHHKDHFKQLDIEWLCAPCHTREDARLRRERAGVQEPSRHVSNLAEMIKSYMAEEEVSLRDMARLVGLPHSAMFRFVSGYPIGQKNFLTIVKWLFT